MSVYNKYIKPYNKGIEDLLDSNLQIETKIHFINCSLNNLSKRFVKALNPQSRNGKYNTVLTKEGEMSIVVTTSDKPECRQTYEGVVGFYCYNILKDKIFKSVKTLEKGRHTGSDIRKASSTIATEFKEISLQQFEQEVL